MLSELILKLNMMAAFGQNNGIDDILGEGGTSETAPAATGGQFDAFKNASLGSESAFSEANNALTNLLALIYKLEYRVAVFSFVICIICTGIAWALSRDSRDNEKNKKGLITLIIAGAAFFGVVSIVDVLWLQITR